MITFTFDDGYATDYTIMFPVFAAKGIVGVSGIIASFVETGVYMNWAQIQGLQAAGWEIADHSNTHASWATMTAVQMQAEIDNGRATFAANGITQPMNFVYPGGLFCDRGKSILKTNGFRSARGHTGKKNMYGTVYFDLYDLGAYLIDDHTTLPYWKNVVDVINTTKEWAIFFAHQTDSNDATAIGEIIDYIQARNIPIVTISQALNRLGI